VPQPLSKADEGLVDGRWLVSVPGETAFVSGHYVAHLKASPGRFGTPARFVCGCGQPEPSCPHVAATKLYLAASSV
jgi:hypothetical protein